MVPRYLRGLDIRVSNRGDVVETELIYSMEAVVHQHGNPIVLGIYSKA
jgi:hypothetical protein